MLYELLELLDHEKSYSWEKEVIPLYGQKPLVKTGFIMCFDAIPERLFETDRSIKSIMIFLCFLTFWIFFMIYILSKLLVCLFIFFNEMIVNDSNSCKSLNVFYKSNNNMINNYKNYKISVLKWVCEKKQLFIEFFQYSIQFEFSKLQQQ